MKTPMKSLAAVVALAAAGLANAQTYTITGGWDREIPPNFVNGNWIAINQDPNHSCVASFWGVEISVDSFTWLGDTFTNPVWSTGNIADCTKLPDDMVPMGPLGGASGLDGTYRVIYNLCPGSGPSPFPLVSGSSSATPPDWDCVKVLVTAAVVLPPTSPTRFTPLFISVKGEGIDSVPTKSLTWDVY